MRKDLIIGLCFSTLVHWSFLYMTQKPTVQVKHAAAAVDDTIKIEMPELAQEEPEKLKDETPQDEDAVQVTFAPPSLVDIPTVVPDAGFVQTVEPPPPPGVEAAKGVVTIPTTRPAGFGRGMQNLFDISQLDQIPIAKVQGQPQYPYEMRRAGIAGEVNVAFIVNVNGDVQDAYAVSSSHREFEAPAVQAVMRWKFRPGRRGGKVVNTRMSVPIIFSLND